MLEISLFGFGTIADDDRVMSIRMVEGELRVERLVLTVGTETRFFEWKIMVPADAIEIKPFDYVTNSAAFYCNSV